MWRAKKAESNQNALLGNASGQTQQSRLEFGLGSAIDSEGRTLWIVDAHRDDGKRFVVRSDEMPSAFLELERITHELALTTLLGDDGH